MSNATAVAPERATKATSRAKAANSPATTPAPKTRPELSGDDRLAMAVGEQIFYLITPIIEGPLERDQIVGFEYLSDAMDHAWYLCTADAEWTEPGPAPTIAELIQAVWAHLHHAMVEMVCSTDTSHAAKMHCVRLLAADALNIATSLQAAYQGLPSTSADLAALTDFLQPIAGARQFRERPSPPIRRVEAGEAGQVTAATFSHDAGHKGTTMVIRCAYDIEGIADAVTNLGDEAASIDEHGMAALLRCYGTRVKELNSMVISHLDQDHITLSDVQFAIYRGAQRLPSGALE